MAKATTEKVKAAIQEKPRKSFNDLFAEYAKISYALETGEATDELEDLLLANKEDFEDKLLGIYYVIKQQEGKIDSFYKTEAEFLSGRVKRIKKNIDFLKDRCMLIVELYGVDNKITTDALNCSKVVKEVLDTDILEFEPRCQLIKESISFNALEDITDDEQDNFKVSLSFETMDIETAAKIVQIIRDKEVDFGVKGIPTANIGLSLNSNSVLSQLQDARDYNNGITAERIDEQKKYPEMIFPELQLRTVEIKGVSIGTTTYPRFS